MIKNFIQPKEIKVDDTLMLVKYYPYYRRTFSWYQDPQLCKQVDNIDFVYDLDRLKRMYRYLSKNGECYYIKVLDNNIYRLVGDISLCDGQIGMAISREYQNRHIGRKSVTALLQRAKEIGPKMFLSVGFRQISSEHYIYQLT